MVLLREYILSIASASIITGILTALLDKKGTAGTLGKVLCGIFLAITLIRPLGTFSFDSITDWIDTYSDEASFWATEGEAMASAAIQSDIKLNCEAYIQDEGARMGLDLNAFVDLDSQAPFAPVSVTIYGIVPPYKKADLEAIIVRDFSIPKEQIQWK